MRAINHTVTGAVIGALVASPVIALPAAFLSHFLLDIIPHSGGRKVDKTSRLFKIELLIDAALSASFLLALLVLKPDNWQLMIACGIAAAAPDLLWFPYWLWELRGKPREMGTIGRFLAWIQWYEKPWGYVIEGLWLIGLLYAFASVTTGSPMF